jgi:hypothetical protein
MTHTGKWNLAQAGKHAMFKELLEGTQMGIEDP